VNSSPKVWLVMVMTRDKGVREHSSLDSLNPGMESQHNHCQMCMTSKKEERERERERERLTAEKRKQKRKTKTTQLQAFDFDPISSMNLLE
jgi:predicted nucleic acid-binding Zn ribbon protein